MVVVTVFLLNQMDIHLVQNQKENCHYNYVPFRLKGNVFSVCNLARQIIYIFGDSFPFDFEPNGIEFGSNWKENCHHDHIPFNLKGNGNIVFSAQPRLKRCELVCGQRSYSHRGAQLWPVGDFWNDRACNNHLGACRPTTSWGLHLGAPSWQLP